MPNTTEIISFLLLPPILNISADETVQTSLNPTDKLPQSPVVTSSLIRCKGYYLPWNALLALCSCTESGRWFPNMYKCASHIPKQL